LNNHLGNVLATITDRRLQAPDGTTVDHYEADIASAQSYYAFGMEQPGLTYNGGTYRYGFNGKEMDKDMDGNNYDYGFRIYNPQIGRFLSLDPLQIKFPWYTPFQFSGNSPILNVDLDGREEKSIWQNLVKLFTGRGPQPHNAEEASEQANDIAAVHQFQENIQNMSDAYENTLGPIPGVSAAFEYQKGNTKTATAYLLLDVFSEELLRYGSKGLKYIKPQALFKVDITATKLFGKIAASEGKFVITIKNVAKVGEKAWYKYQKQINGLSGAIEFLRNGVKFDGFKNGVLLEAKSQFQWLFKTGRATEREVYEKMTQQLSRQVGAADGLKLEWHFAEKETKEGLENYLKTQGREDLLKKVTLIYTPAK